MEELPIPPWRRAFFWAAGRLQELGDSLIYRWSGGERRPVFHDVDRTVPELRRIDEGFDVIRAELEELLREREAIPRYHEVDGEQRGISDHDERAWRTFFVAMHWAGDALPTRARCPRTAAIVESIPNYLQAFFSILEPGKDVPPHNGPSLTYLRYHTAFVVPPVDPPELHVHDRSYIWKERESLLFDDSWSHEVRNASEGLRVVLVVDVLRPLPAPLHAFNLLLRWLRIPRWQQRDVLFERLERA